MSIAVMPGKGNSEQSRWFKSAFNQLKRIVAMVYDFIVVFRDKFGSDFFYHLGNFLKASKEIKRYYRDMSEEALLAHKKSDTVFLVGSGYSINDLTKKDVSFMEQHDIFAFSTFLDNNKFFRVDFYLGREFFICDETMMSIPFMRKFTMIDYYFSYKANHSKYCGNTIFFVQHEVKSNMNSILARRLLKKGTKIFRFKSDFLKWFRFPSKNLRKLMHFGGTLADALHACYAMGYRKIILVGIDLYDRQYYWLKENETYACDIGRGNTCTDPHRTSNNMVNAFKRWKPFFDKNGVEVYVLNPKSLLAEVLPVYKFPHHMETTSKNKGEMSWSL